MASAFAGDPSTSSSIAVAHALGSDIESGLSAMEAARRHTESGPNELLEGPRMPEWRRVLAHYQNPLVYLLLVAVTVAFVAWFVEGQIGYPVDALVIASVVLINGVLGYLQDSKADKAVAALARMTAVTCSVVRGGTMVRIPASGLVPGDLLALAEGDAVGADARLVDATSLRVQEASLTGESSAVLKDASVLLEPAAIASRLNMVFKGTAVVQGAGRAVVTATGMGTEMGSIAAMLEETIEAPTPLQVEVEKIGMRLGVAVVLVAIVVVSTILLASDIKVSDGVIQVLLLGVSLAVAAVPEGLAAILTVVLALGVQRLAKHHAIVKKLSSVETLGSASVIASDKTGTLTRAEMTIVRVVTASGSTDITGVGYAPDGAVESSAAGQRGVPIGDALRAEQTVVLSGGSLANNAQLRQKDDESWEIQGDPTEAAFLVAERKLGVNKRREQRFKRIGELPFTSERKMMSIVAQDHERGDEVVVVTKGAPDVLLQHCTRLRVGKDVRVLDSDTRRKLLTDVDTLSGAALRTLAVAYRPLDANEAASTPTSSVDALERNLIFVGTVGIIDPPRDEAAVAVAEAQRAGIRIIMMTGDHPRTAARIASDLGIVPVGEAALTGLELDALDDAGFAEVVRTRSVFARVAPANKLRIVNVLREFGNVVAVTGDGVNDAPALKAADIGIAMGRTGTEVSKEAAKMILADDNFATIVEA
ncbi:MAG: HAD-IC family P-type ATPase, partial [Pseudomonadota bacterium]|nr:HAD-IC family P-type ATPase [Pseudomonadota bacterium]